MRVYLRASLAAAAMSSTAAPLHAQPVSGHHHHVAEANAVAGGDRRADSVAADFLARAKTASGRYRRLEAAIADGYRRVGIDFPTLGEHWAHIATAATSGLDPERPPVIIYVRTGNGPELAGLAYTALLQPGDPYPAWPAGSHVWHEHNGSIEEESAPLSHALMVPSRGRVRVAVMHAWVWVENPDGIWMSDNPALPFHRLGLQIPGLSPDLMRAAHAAALLTDGANFYAGAILRAGALGDADGDRVRALLAAARDRSVAILGRQAHGRTLTESEVAQLGHIWTAAIGSMSAIRADSSARFREALATLVR